MGIFSDAQGQLTPQSVVQSSQNSNSSELSCMSSLPASMKRIRELELMFMKHYAPNRSGGGVGLGGQGGCE